LGEAIVSVAEASVHAEASVRAQATVAEVERARRMEVERARWRSSSA
jgi:hypothetical protein